MLSASQAIQCFLFHPPGRPAPSGCPQEGGRSSERPEVWPVSVLQATVRWPRGRGDLVLDIELHSGTSTEHLPHARLWAPEHESDTTPTLEGFTGQCEHLTQKQEGLVECLGVSTDSGAGLPGHHLAAVLIWGKPLMSFHL